MHGLWVAQIRPVALVTISAYQQLSAISIGKPICMLPPLLVGCLAENTSMPKCCLRDEFYLTELDTAVRHTARPVNTARLYGKKRHASLLAAVCPSPYDQLCDVHLVRAHCRAGCS